MPDPREDQLYWYLKKEHEWVSSYNPDLRKYAKSIGIVDDLWKVLRSLVDHNRVEETPARGRSGEKLYRAK